MELRLRFTRARLVPQQFSDRCPDGGRAMLGRLFRLRNRIQIFAFPYKPDSAGRRMLRPRYKWGSMP
jgi:hypothetical protein